MFNTPLSRLLEELQNAHTYAEWRAIAASIDRQSGAEEWRASSTCDLLDVRRLEVERAELAACRQAGDALGLVDALETTLLRHQGDLSAPELYEVALCGTRHVVERWHQEVEASLDWLSVAPIPGLDEVGRLARFERASKVFGRSALVLSGGATWGFHHLGVVKALFENDLLPSILSGASTGAMIAAGVCTRNDAELAEMFRDTDSIRLDGLLPVGWGRVLSNRGFLEPARLQEVLRHNIGVFTFEEAWRQSGRALNISVAPVRTRQKPRLLSHLTAPDVLVHSAAMASSSLPGLFPAAPLEQRTRDGSTAGYISGERWVDGSLYADLPKLRLARLHNVNNFILSQTNPHALPFARLNARDGVVPTLAGMASAAALAQGGLAVNLLGRAGRVGTGNVGAFVNHAQALVRQPYRGDIDISPRFRWDLVQKVVRNPSRKDLDTFILEGERAAWPLLARIRDQTRVERALQRAIRTVRMRISATSSP